MRVSDRKFNIAGQLTAELDVLETEMSVRSNLSVISPVVLAALLGFATPISASEGSLLPTAPTAQSREFAQQVRVTLVKDGFAPSAFELVRGVLLFQAEVSGKQVWVMLDTGASHTIIDSNLADQLGLRTENIGGVATTIFGQSKTSLVHDVRFTVPNQIAFTAAMTGLDLRNISRITGRNVSIILGADYLSSIAFYINHRSGRIYFRASESITPKAGYHVIPVSKDMLVDGKVNGIPVKLKLDLGNSGVVSLSAGAWARTISAETTKIDSQAYDSSGKLGKITYVQSVPFNIGSISAESPISTEHKSFEESDGLLGMAFFSNFNTIFDIPAGKIVVMPR